MIQRFIALQKVVEMGSFSKAAEAMGYTQSSMSQMISSLEESLSIVLLNRSRKGISLTHEGEELYPHIERAIYQYRAAEERAKEIRGLDTGTVRIGTLSSISAHWMPRLLAEFKAMYPGVNFVIHLGDYSSIQEWIKTGAVDFGFVNPAAVSGLNVIRVKEGLMPAILPEDHPFAQLERVPLDALADEPFILLEEGHYNEPLEAFQAQGLEPNVKYTLHDDYTIMTMVEAGLGVSIISDLVMYRTNYDIVRRITEPPIYRTIAIGVKDRASLSAASRRFIDLILSKAEKLP